MVEQGEEPGVGRRMARGAAWLVALRLSDRFIGLVSTLILARLLVPEDFGLVALATTILAVIEIWSEFGFDLALIRDQKATQDDYDTAWTLTVIRGLTAAAMLGAGAPLAADFFGDPRLENVLYAIAFMSLADGFQSIRVVDFRKGLALDKEFRFVLAGRLSQVAVTLALAFVWRDYWALIAGILAGRAVRLVLSYAMAPHRPRFTLCRLGVIFSFSKWIVFASVINFVTTRLDTFVIGRVSTAGALGIYNIAYEISNLATTELVWPITRAIFPGFAQVAESRESLVWYFHRSLAMIVTIALPAAIGIGMTADFLVPLLLGPKWLAAIPIMQVLAFYGAIRVLLANIGSFYMALNKPYLIVMMGLSNLVVLLPTMIWLVEKMGAIGAAWAVVAGSIPMLAFMLVANKRLLQIGVLDTVKQIARPVVAAAAMAAVLFVWRNYLSVSEHIATLALQVAALVITGAAVYIGVLLLQVRLIGDREAVEYAVLDLIVGKFRRAKAG